MSVSLLPFLVSTNRLDFLPCCPLLCLHTFGRKNTITWRISCRNFLIVEFQSQCIRPFPQPIRRVLGLQCQVSYPLFSIVVSTPSYRLSTYPADLPILNILESSGLGRTGRCHLPSVGGGGLSPLQTFPAQPLTTLFPLHISCLLSIADLATCVCPVSSSLPHPELR